MSGRSKAPGRFIFYLLLKLSTHVHSFKPSFRSIINSVKVQSIILYFLGIDTWTSPYYLMMGAYYHLEFCFIILRLKKSVSDFKTYLVPTAQIAQGL